MLYQILGGRIKYINSRDQIVQSGNYCDLFLSVISRDVSWWQKEKKKTAGEGLPWLIQTMLPFMQVNKRRVLAPVFEKSAAEPKLNLLRCKNIVNILLTLEL